MSGIDLDSCVAICIDSVKSDASSYSARQQTHPAAIAVHHTIRPAVIAGSFLVMTPVKDQIEKATKFMQPENSIWCAEWLQDDSRRRRLTTTNIFI